MLSGIGRLISTEGIDSGTVAGSEGALVPKVDWLVITMKESAYD